MGKAAIVNICISGNVVKSTVTADASGDLILPEGDTLHKVLRIHTHKKDSSEYNPER